ncbi:family 16 glycosylhydrolase [Clostridium sardiniense]|uniref:family 16 glycosylhydrolase n=1 Tax=Clostridium sardiniense TaxID=29369 RepID=UPI003D347FAE
MKRKLKFSTLLLGVLTGCFSLSGFDVVQSSDNNYRNIIELNYLKDGDFEEKSNNWFGNKGKIVEGISYDNGNYSGSIIAGTNSGFIGQNVLVKKNTDYTLSAYVKSDYNDSYGFLSVREGGDGSGKLIKDIKVLSAEDNWKKVELKFNSGDNEKVLLQYVKWIKTNDSNYNDLVNSTLYVDNVNLIESSFSVDKYTEVWSDNFNGDVLESANWRYELGHIRGTEEQEYVNSKENVFVKDGNLYLRATKKDVPKTIIKGNGEKRVLKYDSGSIETFGRKEALYGRIEMRAKLPSGAGAFPAFWTLGSDFNHDGLIQEGTNWPNCGEIDIMELIGKNQNQPGTSDNIVYGTLHYGTNDNDGYKKQGGSYDLGKSFSDDYHIFGINWTKDFIEWYVDGYVYNRIDIRDNEYFNKPHYIKLNLAVGGSWPGYADETTTFPMDYVIDYVKYYQTEEQMKEQAEYEKNSPKIDLSNDTYTISKGDSIPDLLSGVVSKDTEGNNLEVKYSIEDGEKRWNEAELNKPGKYSIVYTAKDKNNRYARAFATLIIND